MSFNLPNPCLLAILVTISTHKGPQFVLHYPPDPDNHGYQAAPIVHNSSDDDEENNNDDDDDDDDDNDGSSTYFSDTDEVLTDEDSDGDIPRNYDNAKDEGGSRRDSDTSMYTASTHTDQRSTRQQYRNSHHNGFRSHRKGAQAKLTRSETNPLNPIHRTALKEAKVIEGLERAKRNAAAAKREIDDTSMEDSFTMNKGGARRRSSMNDTTRPTTVRRSSSGGGLRRHSSHAQRPIIDAMELMQVSESAIVDDDDGEDTESKSVSRNSQVTTTDTIKAFRAGLPIGAKQDDTMTISSRGSKKGDSIVDNLRKPVVPSWKTVLGFDTLFLSELLVPSRYLCNKRFELTVDDMVFLGCPVHVLPDGYWVKKKREKPHHKDASSSRSKRKSRVGNTVAQEDDADDEFEASMYDQDGVDGDALQQDNYVEDEHMEKEDDVSAAAGQEYDDPKSDMRMFHVVFVLNPPVIEYSFRIEEMYHHIISKFVGSLRHEQAKSNYVWNEVSKIMQVRDRASQEGMINGIVLNKIILFSNCF
jgi:hypothetical protein